MKQDERNNAMSDPTSVVETAGSSCHQGATAVNSSAQTHAEHSHTGSANGPKVDDVLTLTNSSRQQGFYLKRGYTRSCDVCGREYVAKRDTSKYCSGNCRQRAWMARHPDKAQAKTEKWRAFVKRRFQEMGLEWEERP